MFFWRIRNLVKLLGERELTEREAFQYFFVYLVLITGLSEIPTPDWNEWDTAGAVASTVVTILGLLYCFRSNGGAAGEAFLARFSALMLVVSIRTAVFLIPLMIAVMGAADLLGVLSDDTSWFEFVLVTAVGVLVYLRVAAHLRTVNALRRQYVGWAARREAAAPSGSGPEPTTSSSPS